MYEIGKNDLTSKNWRKAISMKIPRQVWSTPDKKCLITNCCLLLVVMIEDNKKNGRMLQKHLCCIVLLAPSRLVLSVQFGLYLLYWSCLSAHSRCLNSLRHSEHSKKQFIGRSYLRVYNPSVRARPSVVLSISRVLVPYYHFFRFFRYQSVPQRTYVYVQTY